MSSGGEAQQLNKEALRMRSLPEAYNETAVKAVFGEISLVFEDTCQISKLQNDDVLDYANEANVRLVALKGLIDRNKRILLAYHASRLDCIASVAGQARDLPGKYIDLLNKIEIGFHDQYKANLQEYNMEFGGAIDLLQWPQPPKDLYIQVRVNKDCGVIQTEWGQIHLSANSFHFLRRSDVQALINQGLVSHIP